MADRIIVVDDEREIADLIGLYLENDGYEVHKFLNGADALSFVEKCEPALAVLDVMLPDTDGFALLRKMREKYLSITLDKAERLEDLINEFFEITRFNLSTVTLDYSSIDLVRLLEQLRFEFMPMLKEKSLTCTLCAPDALPISCDAGKMQRVFDNLLRNAVLYSYPDTEIVINAQLDGDSVSVSVLTAETPSPRISCGAFSSSFTGSIPRARPPAEPGWVLP